MTTPIQPDQYETWETIILTGQLDQLGAGKLFEANRSKIEADPANPVHLVTVRGLGYKLEG